MISLPPTVKIFLAVEPADMRKGFVSSAKANHVEPWAWLRDLFTYLPGASAETLDSLLPDRWLTASPASRWHIDDLRGKERDRKRG